MKEAWVESRFYGLRTAIKNFGIDRFKLNSIKATEGFNHVLSGIQEQQMNFQRIKQEKMGELQHIKDQLITQYREKAEVLKEKSSQGWNQAKETAMAAAHRATAPTSLHATEKED